MTTNYCNESLRLTAIQKKGPFFEHPTKRLSNWDSTANQVLHSRGERLAGSLGDWQGSSEAALGKSPGSTRNDMPAARELLLCRTKRGRLPDVGGRLIWSKTVFGA